MQRTYTTLHMDNGTDRDVTVEYFVDGEEASRDCPGVPPHVVINRVTDNDNGEVIEPTTEEEERLKEWAWYAWSGEREMTKWDTM